MANCSDGFFNRVQLCFECVPPQADMLALLADLRVDVLGRARSELGVKEIHAYERFRIVANEVLKAAIPVFDTEVKDPHRGRYTQDQIMTAVISAFKEHYAPHRIVENLFQSPFSSSGYRGALSEADGYYGDNNPEFYAKISGFFNMTMTGDADLEWQELFLLDEQEECPFELKWSRIISATIEWFFEQGYFKESALNFIPASYMNGSSLRLSLDTDTIENKDSTEKLQFFLGNARYFAPDNREISDRSYMLESHQAQQLVDMVNLLPETYKNKIRARLLLAGFDVKAQELTLKRELRQCVVDARDLGRVLSRLHDLQAECVLHQLLKQGVLEVIKDTSDLSDTLKKLTASKQTLLLAVIRIPALIVSGAGINKVFSVLKSDALREFAFEKIKSQLSGLLNTMADLLTICECLDEAQQAVEGFLILYKWHACLRMMKIGLHFLPRLKTHFLL